MCSSYRQLDGRFNNQNKTSWGSTNIDLKRLSPPAYADNISEPSGACTRHHHVTGSCPYPRENSGIGSTRPSPRFISNELLRQVRSRNSTYKIKILHDGHNIGRIASYFLFSYGKNC